MQRCSIPVRKTASVTAESRQASIIKKRAKAEEMQALYAQILFGGASCLGVQKKKPDPPQIPRKPPEEKKKPDLPQIPRKQPEVKPAQKSILTRVPSVTAPVARTSVLKKEQKTVEERSQSKLKRTRRVPSCSNNDEEAADREVSKRKKALKGRNTRMRERSNSDDSEDSFLKDLIATAQREQPQRNAKSIPIYYKLSSASDVSNDDESYDEGETRSERRKASKRGKREAKRKVVGKKVEAFDRVNHTNVRPSIPMTATRETQKSKGCQEVVVSSHKNLVIEKSRKKEESKKKKRLGSIAATAEDVQRREKSVIDALFCCPATTLHDQGFGQVKKTVMNSGVDTSSSKSTMQKKKKKRSSKLRILSSSESSDSEDCEQEALKTEKVPTLPVVQTRPESRETQQIRESSSPEQHLVDNSSEVPQTDLCGNEQKTEFAPAGQIALDCPSTEQPDMNIEDGPKKTDQDEGLMRSTSRKENEPTEPATQEFDREKREEEEKRPPIKLIIPRSKLKTKISDSTVVDVHTVLTAAVEQCAPQIVYQCEYLKHKEPEDQDFLPIATCVVRFYRSSPTSSDDEPDAELLMEYYDEEHDTETSADEASNSTLQKLVTEEPSTAVRNTLPESAVMSSSNGTTELPSAVDELAVAEVDKVQASAPEIVEAPAPDTAEAPPRSIVEGPSTNTVEAPTPEIVEAPAPYNVEAPPPDIAEAPAPDVLEGPSPDIAEAPAPYIIEAPAPDIVEGPSPNIVEAPASDTAEAPPRSIVEGPSTDTVEAPPPEIVEAPAPCNVEALPPDIAEAPAPYIIEAPAPGIVEVPAPDIAEAPPPGIVEAPRPDIAEAPAPEIVEAPAPDLAEAPPSALFDAEHWSELSRFLQYFIDWRQLPYAVRSMTVDHLDPRKIFLFKPKQIEDQTEVRIRAYLSVIDWETVDHPEEVKRFLCNELKVEPKLTPAKVNKYLRGIRTIFKVFPELNKCDHEKDRIANQQRDSSDNEANPDGLPRAEGPPNNDANPDANDDANADAPPRPEAPPKPCYCYLTRASPLYDRVHRYNKSPYDALENCFGFKSSRSAYDDVFFSRNDSDDYFTDFPGNPQ